MSSTDAIRVIRNIRGTMYRDILQRDQYTDINGQIILPDGYYSAAYVYRLCEREWEDFPVLPPEERDTIGECTGSNIITIVDNNQPGC